jgi:hypothetical protein
MRYLEVVGTGRERGLAHGEALRELIHEHLARWKQALVEDVVVDPDTYVDEFLADTDFVSAAARWTPDLLAEVRGICECAGTDWRYTFVRQLSDEEPWYRRGRKLGIWPGRSRLATRDAPAQSPAGAAREKGCSSVGCNARDGQAMLIAQNMDTPTWYDGHQLLLKVVDPATGVQAFVFTLVGKLSLAGMNSRGLGMTCNTLSQLDYNVGGLAEDFVVRGYLAQPDVQRGLDFLHQVPHASGQNYTVPGPAGEVLDLECSRRGVVAWRPWAGADRVFHTNHPLLSTDNALYRAQVEVLAPEQRARLTTETSRSRLDELRRWFADAAEPVTTARIKAALSSKLGPVCRDGEHEGRKDGYTLGCLVMTLGDAPLLELSPGPPSRTPFETFRF